VNIYTVKNCRNCPYLKCVMRTSIDFKVCPVGGRVIINKDKK